MIFTILLAPIKLIKFVINAVSAARSPSISDIVARYKSHKEGKIIDSSPIVLGSMREQYNKMMTNFYAETLKTEYDFKVS